MAGENRWRVRCRVSCRRLRSLTIAFAVILPMSFDFAHADQVSSVATDGDKALPSPIASKPGPGAQVDKSGFTFLNPVPLKLMRTFITDRPSITESPYTVDAGHFQFEFSFIEYAYDGDRERQTRGFSVFPANLKVGLLNNLDLELVLNPAQDIRTKDSSGTSRTAGFGDAVIRAKLNLWGNDGGKTAFGVMPFIRFPTGADGLSNHHVEGGLILPLDMHDLPGGFDLGTMAEFDLNRNKQNQGYGVDFVHTVSLGHEVLSPRLTAYVEYVGIAPIRTGHSYLAYFDTGVTFALEENILLDTGINLGLSRHAGDFTVFIGMSFRL